MKYNRIIALLQIVFSLLILSAIALLSCTQINKAKIVKTETISSLSTPSFDTLRFPPLDQLAPRFTSGTTSISPEISAKDKKTGTDLKSAGVTLASPLSISTKPSELQWVIYSYGPCNSTNKPVDISLNLTGTTGTLWVGLANFSKNTWEWQAMNQASFASEKIVYNIKNQYYHSSTGACYLVLAAYNGCNLKFNGATINTSGEFPAGPAIVLPTNWTFHFVEEGTSVGAFNQIALINNVPAILYDDTNKYQVRYAYGSKETPQATADWTKMAIDGSSSARRGKVLDLSQWNNIPIAIYTATSDQRLWFAYSKTPSPTATADWNKYQPNKDGRSEPQVITTSTGPALFMNDLTSAIKYAHSTNPEIPADAAGWNAFETVEKTDKAYFYYTCATVINDKPVCTYQQMKEGFGELRISFFDSPGVWTSYTLDSIDISPDQANAGLNPIIATWNGGIAIAYGNKPLVGNQSLRYAYTTVKNPTKPSDWTLHQVSAVPKTDTGKDIGLVFFNEKPVLFYNNVDSALHIAAAKTSTPTAETDWDFGILEKSTGGYGINGTCNPLILKDGTLALVYRTSQGLKFGTFNP